MPPRPKRAHWREVDAWREAQQAIVARTMSEVAGLLGCTFETHEQTTFYLMRGTLAIHIYFDDYRDRVNISPRWPYRLAQHISSGSQADPECAITVSSDRPAEQVAAAIRRRFIPVYEALYTILSQRAAMFDAKRNAEGDLAQRIAAHGRGKVLDQNPMRPHYSEAIKAGMGAGWGKPGPYGTAEISTRDGGLQVDMTLRKLPPELAVYIASLLGEWGDDEDANG